MRAVGGPGTGCGLRPELGSGGGGGRGRGADPPARHRATPRAAPPGTAGWRHSDVRLNATHVGHTTARGDHRGLFPEAEGKRCPLTGPPPPPRPPLRPCFRITRKALGSRD